jgi:hypothetical protein
MEIVGIQEGSYSSLQKIIKRHLEKSMQQHCKTILVKLLFAIHQILRALFQKGIWEEQDYKKYI